MSPVDLDPGVLIVSTKIVKWVPVCAWADRQRLPGVHFTYSPADGAKELLIPNIKYLMMKIMFLVF